MITNKMATPKGELTVINNIENILSSSSDLIELYLNTNSETIVIDQSVLPQNFYDLKTKIAGDFLQKVSSYNKRLIITTKFSSPISKSLHDFIYESNKTGKVIFADTLENGIKMLK